MAFFLPAAAGTGIGIAAIILAATLGLGSLGAVWSIISNIKIILIVVGLIFVYFLIRK